MAPFAAFVIVVLHNGGIAATTRPGEAGQIGLPGGKVLPGETGEQAARREANEEGWYIPAFASLTLCHVARVEGQRVEWYVVDDGDHCHQLAVYTEQGRLSPCVSSKHDIANSGFGNAFIALRDDIPSTVSLPRQEAEELLLSCRRRADADGERRVVTALQWVGEQVILPA